MLVMGKVALLSAVVLRDPLADGVVMRVAVEDVVSSSTWAFVNVFISSVQPKI